MNRGDLIHAAGQLLGKSAQAWNATNVLVAPLVPDGSSRRFFHLIGPEHNEALAILPPENDERGMAEAVAFYHIGKHLQQAGVPVPAIFAFEQTAGLVLCEHLGPRRLYELVSDQGIDQALPWYEQAVRMLALMQVRGAVDFNPSWCWDTPRYDRQVMQERESVYFLRACCTDFLQLSFDRVRVEADCLRIAEQASQAPACYFLHRDFQCRNIMVSGDEVRFIDFQGGRLGPLAYDLASLLLDPYAALPPKVQTHLSEVYLEALGGEIPYDPHQFQQEYVVLAIQRTLQILGAFSFLSQVREKPFFAQFIEPALDSLGGLLAKPEAAEYAALRTLTDQCRQECAKRS